MFAAGDLLLSLRNLNLLMVVDPRTRQVKWTRTGPFLRQHDPDFLPDGRIAVFDNRRDGDGGQRFGGSRILAIDPRSVAGDTTIYGARPGEHFYTDTMGDHQPLANGHQLISESHRGHAFEVAPDGTVVWSWVNRWQDGSVGKITQATRYPADYLAQSQKESCHEN